MKRNNAIMQAQVQPFISLTPEALRGKPDGELVRLYADARSEAAFAELARRYARLIYATCLRETQDRTLAEDASQGVFLLLSRKAGSLKRCETLAGWLYSASRYVARNVMKQERRRQIRETEAAQLVPEPQQAEASWERIERHLNAALEHLKPVDREAILLRFVQEQSLAEIGACFGVSENTARMRVARALEKMRRRLAKAGVAITVAALAGLLDTQTAQAIPASVCEAGARAGISNTVLPSAANITRIVQRAAMRPTRRQTLGLLTSSAVGFLLLGGAVGAHFLGPQPLSQTEQRRLFTSLVGNWRGSLEYADDRTRRHFTYPTTVIVRASNQGDALQFTATYTGTTNEDITTFTRNPNTGLFAVDNGGPQSSHSLMGKGALLRLSGSEVAFEGTDVARNRETRLRIFLRPQQLTMQEEYRSGRGAKYEFRNRFSLTK